MANEADKVLILTSGLFDRDWYVAQIRDRPATVAAAIEHYLNSDPETAADPHPLFHHRWYREVYPDVAKAGVNPLLHFLWQGATERRRPNPMFDTGWYLEKYPDVSEAGVNPLVHFLTQGSAENRNPHPDFDTAWYRQQIPDLNIATKEPLSHYLVCGAGLGLMPGPQVRSGTFRSKGIKATENGLRVHIKYSDSGWILERLARELVSKLDYVTADLTPDPSAPIQYYMNYAERGDRVSPIEFAFFTHIEESDTMLSRRFFEMAHAVDVAICMSTRYANLLREDSVRNLFVITPGIDLDNFVPKIKIGVVGRSYSHSGRKGESMLTQLIGVPGIEWHFTGKGWPLPSRHLDDHEMPGFYQSMDYILVSSLYEGGPMSVLEALACGTPVIAPPVGWVPDFPHIEYATGDINDLRRVLNEAIERKTELRRSVEHLTWQRFAQQHDDLFRHFYQNHLQASISK